MANVTTATTGIATGVTSSKEAPRLTCQDGITTGTTSAATEKATTSGTDLRPRYPTLSMVRKMNATNPAARANGSSASDSASRMPKQAQNARPDVGCDMSSGAASQHAANTARMV